MARAKRHFLPASGWYTPLTEDEEYRQLREGAVPYKAFFNDEKEDIGAEDTSKSSSNNFIPLPDNKMRELPRL
jgi:hypothetical protein